MKKLLLALFFTIGITVTMAMNTAAYLDPSVMTYMIQIVAGIVIAGGAVFVLYWKKIKLFFMKRLKKSGKK